MYVRIRAKHLSTLGTCRSLLVTESPTLKSFPGLYSFMLYVLSTSRSKDYHAIPVLLRTVVRWVMSVCYMLTGSMPPHSKHLWEEGMCTKSFKLVEKGEFQEEGLYCIYFPKVCLNYYWFHMTGHWSLLHTKWYMGPVQSWTLTACMYMYQNSLAQ